MTSRSLNSFLNNSGKRQSRSLCKKQETMNSFFLAQKLLKRQLKRHDFIGLYVLYIYHENSLRHEETLVFIVNLKIDLAITF